MKLFRFKNFVRTCAFAIALLLSISSAKAQVNIETLSNWTQGWSYCQAAQADKNVALPDWLSAGFDNALIFRLKPAKRRSQLVNRRQHLLFERLDRRNVHRGRECVVRRLGHVDIVVRVQQLCARDLIAAVGDDLVGVHIGLRAAARLPHYQRKDRKSVV